MRMPTFLLLAFLVGCLKQPPPESPPVVVIEVRRIPIPRVQGQMIEVIPDPEPPVHTWVTGEELQKVLDERAKRAKESGEECYDGDPLCEKLP